MLFEFYRAYLGKLKPLFCQPKARLLRICNRIVSVFTFESWIACFTVFLFQSSKETLKSSIYPKQDILKNLRVNVVESFYSFFIGFKNLLLFYARKSFTCLFVMPLSIQKTGVVKNTTSIKSLLKFLNLFLCRVKSVFESFTHFGSLHTFSGLQGLSALLKQGNKKDSKSALPRVSFLHHGTLGISILLKQTLDCSRIWIVEHEVYRKRGYVYGQ